MAATGRSLCRSALLIPAVDLRHQLNKGQFAQPKLGRGVASNGTLELEDVPLRKHRGMSAKQRAAAAIRERGGLQKVDPNTLQVKRTASADALRAVVEKKKKKEGADKTSSGSAAAVASAAPSRLAGLVGISVDLKYASGAVLVAWGLLDIKVNSSLTGLPPPLLSHRFGSSEEGVKLLKARSKHAGELRTVGAPALSFMAHPC